MITLYSYQCSFCKSREVFATPSEAQRHEGRCAHNPDNCGCWTCSNFALANYSREYDAYDFVCAVNAGKPALTHCLDWSPRLKGAK